MIKSFCLMAQLEEYEDNRFKDVDLESILARVERRGPLMLARKRCLYRAPEFVKRLTSEITVDEGSNVCFDCQVVAFPNPKVTWTKDGEPLPDDSRIKTESNDTNGYSLSIEEISKKDEAAYRCRAENSEGSSCSTVYLAVKVLKKEKPNKSPNGMLSNSHKCPVILEDIAEEETEEIYFRTQPESPLTSLYSGTKWKNRTWPDFLYDRNFAMKYYDVFDVMDTEEDEDVFLSEDHPESHTFSSYTSESNENSDSDSEMDISKQNLIFENRNYSNVFSEKRTKQKDDQDVNANLTNISCQKRSDCSSGRNGNPPCNSADIIPHHRVLSAGASCIHKTYSKMSSIESVISNNLSLLAFFISGYTFLALQCNMDPGAFVGLELFVEFLLFLMKCLLDY